MNLIICSYYASLEYWPFEIMIFLAGLLPDSTITTSVLAIRYEFNAFQLIHTCIPKIKIHSFLSNL